MDIFWKAVSGGTLPHLLRLSTLGVRLCWITGTVNEETWTKMAVNLSKNGSALMAAYKEVVDGKSDTNW